MSARAAGRVLDLAHPTKLRDRHESKDGGIDEMKSDAEFGSAARALLDRDEVEGVLSGAFYTPQTEPRRAKPVAVGGDRPAHYKVICISMYNDDLARLDDMVDELKARGLTKANRSALIRHALSQVDLSKVPRGM